MFRYRGYIWLDVYILLFSFVFMPLARKTRGSTCLSLFILPIKRIRNMKQMLYYCFYYDNYVIFCNTSMLIYLAGKLCGENESVDGQSQGEGSHSGIIEGDCI